MARAKIGEAEKISQRESEEGREASKKRGTALARPTVSALRNSQSPQIVFIYRGNLSSLPSANLASHADRDSPA